MDMGLLLTLIVILLYILILVILKVKGAFKEDKLSLWGPFLMWRTQRGKNFIEKMSSAKRFWRIYGNVAIGICFITMILMMFFLIWAATLVPTVPKESAPPPQLLIGIPGVNPIIPIWYGIIALAIAIVVHEFAHGILTRVAKLKIKSLGVIACVVPIGAFVEPDEDELKATAKMKRMRIFGVGPASNIIFAIICALIFSWAFMGSIEPSAEGVFINGIVKDSPAHNASLEPGMIISYVNGTSYNGTELEGIEIKSRNDLSDFLDNTHVNDTINITVYFKGKYRILNATLANRYDYQTDPKDEDRGVGYLGISYWNIGSFSNTLTHPLSSTDTLGGKLSNVFFYILLPFYRLSPFPSHLTDAYTITGPLSFLPEGIFWFLANLFYWLFWLDLMLGLTNALPAVPLDGGHIFKDGLDSIVARIKKHLNEKERERYVKAVSYSLALAVLFLFLWQLIGPRI